MHDQPAPTADPALWRQAMVDDPYTLYERLRSDTPVYWDGYTWTLSRYADVHTALRDPRFAASRIEPDEAWLESSGLGELFRTHARMMLFTDAPDHTRLRGLVSKAFTPRTVEALRPRIELLVNQLIDRHVENGQIELIGDFAYPLPVTVIAELLGVPDDMRAQFRSWSKAIAGFIGGTTGPEDEMLRDAQRAVVEMSEYFLALAAERRKDPRDDLISALALAEEAGDRLSGRELVANSILLLVAGHETTTNLIGNGMLALLQHPDELRRLRDDPALLTSGVEELLRYDSPVQATSRMARADITFDEHTIAAGQHVSLMIGAANRDAAQFAAPDVLDVGRRENRHLSFAHGAHYCLGAPLARLEGQIAIGTLLRRLPKLQLATEQPRWGNNLTLRGLVELPLTF